MKCDHIRTRMQGDTPFFPSMLNNGKVEVCLKEDVDEAIAELKDKVKFCSDFELAARKDIEEMRGQHQMLKQFGHYHLSPVPGKMINHEVRQYVSYNVVCLIIKHLESENAELKKKLDEKESWVKMLSDGEAVMKCDELKAYKADVTIPVYGTIADAEVYLKDKADEAIAELKDKCQMHDFFWEGCGFARRGFKNTIAVSEAFDRLEAENKQLKADVNNVLMQNQELCRALQAMYSVEEYMKLQSENAELKEERRWRKFSEERPKHHQWILVFYPNHSQFTTGVELRRWDDGCKYDVDVQEIYEKWMPLPEPPKEAK